MLSQQFGKSLNRLVQLFLMILLLNHHTFRAAVELILTKSFIEFSQNLFQLIGSVVFNIYFG